MNDFDFDPACDVPDCEHTATSAYRCVKCGELRLRCEPCMRRTRDVADNYLLKGYGVRCLKCHADGLFDDVFEVITL